MEDMGSDQRMSGLRIYHPELRDCILIVSHPGDDRTGRKPKDYQIRIDGEGHAFVSETVWMRLQQARDSGLSIHRFIVLNEILSPPTQRIGVNDEGVEQERRRIYKQYQDIAQEFAPNGVVPRITEKDN
jgi:hypothetical protein